MSTYYIAPGNIQCRIVVHPETIRSPRDHYRQFPEQWKECGLMNFEGKVVALDAPLHVYREFRDSEPLMGGLSFVGL